MGRGAGNCTTELLLSFLKNPKFHVKPVLELIDKYFVEMKAKLQWGYEIPYMITGYLNQHPRAAMRFMEQTDGKDVVAFYDSVMEEE